MVHKDVIDLSERFRKLELHAAKSGRETLRVLLNVVGDSQQSTVSGLMEELQENIRFLLHSLPPYAPPMNNINRVLLVLESAQVSGEGIEKAKSELGMLYKETSDVQSNHEKMAKYLMRVLPQDAVIYTHTLSETVLGVLLRLRRFGNLKLVIVTESRPNNDGWETARRLAERGLKVRLTIDAAMPKAIEACHLVIFGAEIIKADGSVVGKVGAFPAAILCELYNKPLYVVADSNKILPFRQGDFYLNRIDAKAMGVDFSHPSLDITGFYFDITPAHLVHAYVTEMGLFGANEIQSLVSNRKVSGWLAQQLNEREKSSAMISLKDGQI